MDLAPNQCGICRKRFNRVTRCPRIFNCLHTVCNTCIERLIASNARICPFCRYAFRANSANDVMVNRTMLELMDINSVPESVYLTMHNKELDNMMTESRKTSYRNLDYCLEAEKKIDIARKEMVHRAANISQENRWMEYEVLPCIQYAISKNTTSLEELDKTKKQLEIHRKELKDGSTQLEDAIQKLDLSTAKTSKEISTLMDDVSGTVTAVRGLGDSFKEQISKEKTLLHTLDMESQRKAKVFKIVLDRLRSMYGDREVNANPVATAIPINEDHMLRHIKTESLREWSASVRNLMAEGKVFACQLLAGRSRFARVCFSHDNKLCLHHLREGLLPSNAYVVEYDSLMKAVDPSSRLTFLKLCSGDRDLGTLFIRLSPDTKVGQHFSILCTGEKGPSYAGTHILRVVAKGHENKKFVRLGNYENDEGTGRRGLVSLSDERREWDSYRRPWYAGTVTASWSLRDFVASQFAIYTKDFPGKVLDASIGIVEEGLHHLQNAISVYPNIYDVTINDCGMVLPC